MKKDIVFIGPPEYARAFQLLGFVSMEARNSTEALLVVNEVKENFKLLFLSRDVWGRPPEERIIVLPGSSGNQEGDAIKKLIHQALGKEINL